MFISSKKILQSQRYSNHERKRSEEKLKSLLINAAEMPHKQDMSDHPGYINKLFTVRSDLSVSLCKHSTDAQKTKKALKCHYSILQPDIWRRLLPFKIEVLNNFPAIKIIHDFISYQGIIFETFHKYLHLRLFLETDFLKKEAITKGMKSTPYRWICFN